MEQALTVMLATEQRTEPAWSGDIKKDIFKGIVKLL